MFQALRYHRHSILALVAVTGALILSVHPLGPPNYAYATVAGRTATAGTVRSGPRSAWQLALRGETSTIRNITLKHQISIGEVICVIYTDHWPEGVKVLQQVSQDKCEQAGLTLPAPT